MSELFYIGANTTDGALGVSICELDTATGMLTAPRLVAQMANPSFLVLHPHRPLLYVASEVRDYQSGPSGAVSVFAIDVRSGDLALCAEVPTEGMSPCHLGLAPDSGLLAATNYVSGSVAVFGLDERGLPFSRPAVRTHVGSSVDPVRQRSPHPHGAHFTPGGRLLLVPDLGTDRIAVYSVAREETGVDVELACQMPTAPGAGPRHLVFGRGAKVVYCVHELANAVTVFALDAIGPRLRELQTVATLTLDSQGSNTAAELALHPSGRFLYVSNRGADSISFFAIASDGRLEFRGTIPTLGRCPRHFAIDRSGRWLVVANQQSHTLAAFAVDPDTGNLTSHTATVSTPSPTCVQFMPAEA